MPTLSSADLQPVRKQRPSGLSARFYVVVLIAALLMIALQAFPLLHGRGSANAEDAAAQQSAPNAPETTQPETTQPETTQPAAEQPQAEPPAAAPEQPTAAREPQIKVDSPAPSESPAADTPTTTISSFSETKPETTPPPAPPGASAADVVATQTDEPEPAGFGVTLTIEPEESTPPATVEQTSTDDNAAASATPDAAFAFFSSIRPEQRTPSEPTNHERDQSRLAQAQPTPNIWRSVLRVVSAVTKINFEATPADTSEPEIPLADAAAPVAIREDTEESTTESSPSDLAPSPLSQTETLPAATQLIKPANDPSRLVIENPPETGGIVRFLVDGNVSALRPGESLTLRAGATRIQFHRGDDFDNVDVELSGGAYQFRPTKTGWILSQ